jgi:dCTP deaminase
MKDKNMSVLSNTTLRDYLYAGRIVIDPRPRLDTDSDSPYDACSVQLHMAATIQEPKKDLKLSFDLSQKPGALNTTLDQIWEKFEIRDSGYVLEPGKFILAQTQETISFPPHNSDSGNKKVLAGRIEGRSSFARTGLLVHFTAPTIHSGFKGTITLELLNHGPMPLILKPGLAICQLIVETVRGLPTLDFPSQFQNQNTPSGTGNTE